MTEIPPGRELLFLEIPSTFDTKMSLVSVSNSFANNLVGLFFLLVVHYVTQAQQGMWYKMAEGCSWLPSLPCSRLVASTL